MPSVTLHGLTTPKPDPSRRDLVLLADRHQAENYRDLAESRISTAAALAENGDESGANKALYEAVQYHVMAEQADERVAERINQSPTE